MAVVVVPVLVLVPDAIGLFIITLVAFKLHQVQVNIIIFRFRLGTDYNSRDQKVRVVFIHPVKWPGQ